MFHKINYFIYKHELKLGIIGFILSFLYYLYYPGELTLIRTIPLIISWLSVFLIGDAINKYMGKGAIFPHRKDQLLKLERLAVAALLMNIISDMTGAWTLKLWYYPVISHIGIYLALAPLGYILFGLILYVFYKLFKKHYDYLVKPGRLKNKTKKIFKLVIYAEAVIGSIGIFINMIYMNSFSQKNNITWYKVNEGIKADVNLLLPIILWISIFFILEFVCFKLGRETLTRDILHGNLLPIISIGLASLACIVLVEFFNSPFQIWKFTNWPYEHINLFNIPILAYLLWPMQYLLLLPLIRILDGKNEENVW